MKILNKEDIDIGFDLTSICTWEGTARIYDTINKPEEFMICSTNYCEHDGDLNALINQILELKNKVVVINNINVKIVDLEYEVKNKQYSNDGEFSVNVNVKIKVKQYE